MPPENTAPLPNTSTLDGAKRGKFKTSLMIVLESWAVLRQDKEILLFPVVSGVISFLATAVLVVAYVFMVGGGDWASLERLTSEEMTTDINLYAALFVYYLVMFFIVNFFQACIFVVAYARMEGRDLSFWDGVHTARLHVGKIFSWSLVSATVGLFLQMISERSATLGKMVAFFFGAAWNLLTYFSLALLVLGGLGFRDSFKESATMIRKTWGETIITNLGAGLFFMLLAIVGFVVWIVVIFFFPTTPVVFASTFAFGVYCIILNVVATSLNAVFKVALYYYARTNQVPRGFSPELMQKGIQK